MKNQSIAQVAKDINIFIECHSQYINSYQIDSRLVQSGDLFFAIKGNQVDGHQFLAEVRSQGGIAAVVDRNYSGPDFGLTLLVVEDVAASLRELARIDLERSGSRVVGITGSVGKTTTKDFLAELLRGKYRVCKSPRSYNTKLTLPLSILNRDGTEEVLVLEMGMTEPGDIRALLRIAQPEVAVVTRIGLQHADHFPNGMTDIAKEKGEIFSSGKLKYAVFDHGLLDFPEAIGNVPMEKRVSFSLENRSADYFFSSMDGKDWVDERGVRAYPFTERGILRQKHVLHNFLAAASAARQMKLEWAEIHERIPFLELPKMRFECFQHEGVTYINDAYNASPESMRAAFESLPQPQEGGKRIGILGTMAVLGSFSTKLHDEIGADAQKVFDHLLVLGEEARPLFERFQEVKKPSELFTDLGQLTDRLRSLITPGDVVLVKGSRVMQMERIFELLEIAPCAGRT